jgi:hypothetical protein
MSDESGPAPFLTTTQWYVNGSLAGSNGHSQYYVDDGLGGTDYGGSYQATYPFAFGYPAAAHLGYSLCDLGLWESTLTANQVAILAGSGSKATFTRTFTKDGTIRGLLMDGKGILPASADGVTMTPNTGLVYVDSAWTEKTVAADASISVDVTLPLTEDLALDPYLGDPSGGGPGLVYEEEDPTPTYVVPVREGYAEVDEVPPAPVAEAFEV